MLSKVVLRNKDKNGRATVYVQYVNNGDSTRFPTGIKVSPEHFKDGRLTKGYDSHYFRSDNNHIDSIQTRVDSIIKSYYQEYGASPSLDYVKDEYNKEVNLRKVNDKSFFEYFEEYMEYKKQLVTHNTFRNIQGCRNYLKKFEEDTKYRLTLLG